MLRRLVVNLGMIALSAIPAAAQRAGSAPTPTGIKVILTLDSARIRNANVSRDGKWVLFTLLSGDGLNSSIWMATIGNPKPFRITSDGYLDGWPTMAPSGDRILFLSNRPNRDARSKAAFVMSVDIDKATGKPVGPLRQTTTDSLTFMPANGISPDGKWLAYTIQGRPALLRLVPTAGGNARTLATKFSYGGLYTTFTPDGKHVVYQDSLSRLTMEVSVEGGTATLIRRAPAGEQISPAPHSDDRFIVGKDASGTYELQDKSGRSLGVTHIPPTFGTAKVIRTDGLGWVGVSNESWSGLKRVDLSSGAITEALSPRVGVPLGVAPDGSILTHRTVNDRIVLSTLSPAGKIQREITLSPEIKSLGGILPGTAGILARGAELPHVPVKNERGIDTVRRLRPAFHVDRTTGAVRKLADSVLSTLEGTGLGVVHGKMVDMKSIGADGATHLVRSFPRAEYGRFDDASIGGTRLAWADSIGKEEFAIYVATGPTGTPVRLGVIARPDTDDVGTTLSWSPDNRRLAAVFNDARNRARPTAVVYDIADNGSLIRASAPLDLGGTTSDVETVVWEADGSALLVYRDDDSVKGDPYYVTLRSLDPARPPVHLAPSLGDVDDVLIDPTSKSVLISFRRDGGASIWTADFVPVKKPY